jgi:guanosine-3',5'-bis(diphosphate) 3'-pyrophosphohydrolase
MRKDELRTPYFSHPAGVGLILTNYGASEEVIMAGILHDVIEDTKFNYQDLSNEFGQEVAELVKWVTIPNNLGDGIEGKAAYLELLSRAPTNALLVAAADSYYNKADILISLEESSEILSKFETDLKTRTDFGDRKIQIIEDGLGTDNGLVKALREQQIVYKEKISKYL